VVCFCFYSGRGDRETDFNFGLIGIFLGPTVLAVGYTLLGAWIAEGELSEVDGGARNHLGRRQAERVSSEEH
jgi:hypothetical protein